MNKIEYILCNFSGVCLVPFCAKIGIAWVTNWVKKYCKIKVFSWRLPFSGHEKLNPHFLHTKHHCKLKHRHRAHNNILRVRTLWHQINRTHLRSLCSSRSPLTSLTLPSLFCKNDHSISEEMHFSLSVMYQRYVKKKKELTDTDLFTDNQYFSYCCPCSPAA